MLTFNQKKEVFIKYLEELGDIQLNALGNTLSKVVKDDFIPYKKNVYTRTDLLEFALKYSKVCEKFEEENPDNAEKRYKWSIILTAISVLHEENSTMLNKACILALFANEKPDKTITIKEEGVVIHRPYIYTPDGVNLGYGIIPYKELSFSDLKEVYDVYVKNKD